MASESVLITGGAGFIGTALAHRLVADGHRVRVLDTLSSQVHGDDPANTSPLLQAVSKVAEVRVGSVTDRSIVQDALEGIDVVVHLAAETGTGQSMYEIARYVEVNAGGTALLLDVLAAGEHTVRKIVVASSRAIYGEGKYQDSTGAVVYPAFRSDEQLAAGRFELVDPRDGNATLTTVPTDEGSRLSPSSVYGITKLTQEQLVLTSAPTVGVAGVALRYQNVYGPGQSLRNPYTGILSIFSTLIREGSEINIFEDGLESRDFVFIDDVVAATHAAMFSPAADGLAINVGSGVSTTVLDVVAELERAFERSARVVVSGNYRLGDIRHNVADLTLAERVLDYRPTVTFAEGIGRFVGWVKDTRLEAGAYERSLDELRSRSLLK
ncbi:NAD-dependent epimerase/dehydratase family protein [Leifsonia sp. H3M29-4]|uniref:NAD-dependent epimerase/dehydratase family protein n=1 Tax=Salinibacterium metalliresistens TaxID=3031321 RepID=UPI0023DC5110|nr:NAD-dependent epimerase/dehydratase family protein [Salinibacterium metalliresistens]MDF1479144.1 NAD-dependent epimerase/dehydratase family protein [Salinibacterium metalliresistens]